MRADGEIGENFLLMKTSTYMVPLKIAPPLPQPLFQQVMNMHPLHPREYLGSPQPPPHPTKYFNYTLKGRGV